MKIDTFILCFNEERMVRHTLNHYSSISTHITVFDNQSTDNSLQLIKHHFPNVTIETFNTNGQYREDVQIWIRNNCWKKSDADFVIVCDMDEFLYADDLQEILRHAKANNVAIPTVYGFNMFSNSFPVDYDSLITNQVQYGQRDRWFDKNIIFSPRLVKEINYTAGSHACNPTFHNAPKPDTLVELKLLHYKYMDKNYLYSKHQVYAERMSDLNKQHGFGVEYLKGVQHIDDRFSSMQGYLYKVIAPTTPSAQK